MAKLTAMTRLTTWLALSALALAGCTNGYSSTTRSGLGNYQTNIKIYTGCVHSDSCLDPIAVAQVAGELARAEPGDAGYALSGVLSDDAVARCTRGVTRRYNGQSLVNVNIRELSMGHFLVRGRLDGGTSNVLCEIQNGKVISLTLAPA